MARNGTGARLSRRELLSRSASGAAAWLAGGVAPLWARAQPRGGTLRFVYVEPTHLNSALVSGTPTGIPADQIFAGLILDDEKFRPRPYLAERWEVSPDDRTYTFHLRRNAVFHDGRPITSEDVKFSAETVRAHHPFGASIYRALEAIETPDPYTVVFQHAYPYPAFMSAMVPLLLPILPRHVYGTGDILTNPANEKPVGSGPFRFVEWRRGQYLTLERNPNFFLPGLPRLDRIIEEFITDPSAREAAVERQSIQLIPYSYLSYTDALRVRKLPYVALTTRGYEAIGPLLWIEINLRRKELSDVRVRRALAHALDKAFIVKDIELGFGRVADGPIVSSSPFYNPKIRRYQYSLDRANALLDEAGYRRGPGGTRFRLTLDYIPGVPELSTNIADYMRQQYAMIGVDVQIRNSPDFPTWARRMSAWDYDLSLDAVFNYPDPVIGVERTYISSNIKKVVWTNTMGYSNPKVDALFAQAQREPNFAKRKALYDEVQDILTADLPVIWVNEIRYFTVYNRQFEGFPSDVWGTYSPYLEVHRTAK